MASNIQDLKLGLPQSELIQNTKTHIDTLYDQNSDQATAITTAQELAEEAKRIAQQKRKIVAYDTLDAMITALNSATATYFDIGDLIYIKDASYTRDFWVSAKQDTKYTNQTNESGFKADNFEKGYVGYFELSLLDENPDVTNMVTSDQNITDSKIVLGAGNKKVKGSSYSITTNAPSSSSDDNTVPTSKAVSSAIDTKITPVATGLTAEINKIKNGTTTVGKATQATQDADGNAITTTYAKKADIEKYTLPIASETTLGGVKVGENLSVDENGVLSVTINSDEIGKVKDVQVNGESVVDGTTGIANIVINVADLKGNYVEVTPTAVTLNGKSYKAIVVAETDVTLEVLNSEGKAVVTQVIRANGNIYYCLPSTDTNTYTLRKVGGNSVNGSVDISALQTSVTNLTERVESLEGKNLYQHSVTFSASGISISSINYGDNAVMTRSGSIESATITRLLDTKNALNNTNIVGVSSKPISIMGFLKITMSMTNFSNFIHCPIKSISNNTITHTYTIIYIDNKTVYTSAGDPILVSEEVSVDIPHANVTVEQDKVTKIM